uniref:Uncharacterized protein n=1 Tax=Anopheles farauti TaxID=69004 RepID=A0A182QWQ3_9DIPT
MAPAIPRVDVVFLAYSANADRNGDKSPKVTLDSICTVSLYELQRHLQRKRAERASMGVDAYKHYKWYNAALVAELRTTGKGQPRPLLQAFHWYIETSNRAAFCIEGQQYDAVSLVVAAEVEHWYCARPGHGSAHGSRARVSFGVQQQQQQHQQQQQQQQQQHTHLTLGVANVTGPCLPQNNATQRQQLLRATTLERIREEPS